MLISFVVGSSSAFVVSETRGNGGKGLGLGREVETRSGMVAGMRGVCKHGPAPVEHVYYGGLVLTVNGSNEPFVPGNEKGGGGGGSPSIMAAAANLTWGANPSSRWQRCSSVKDQRRVGRASPSIMAAAGVECVGGE